MRGNRLQVLRRAHRLLLCGRCRCLFILCRSCARGRRYCSQACATEARRQLVREAGKRYQRTPTGARGNALRQRAWRARHRGRVTHHSRQHSPSVRPLGTMGASASTDALRPQVFGAEAAGRRPSGARTRPGRPRRALCCSSCGRFCTAFALINPVGPRRTRRRRQRASSPFRRAL